MAAGLGFKDFTTGEVLTAADVDGYLMQGVWVFASAAARDAAVTSPQEGNFAYLKDTNVTTYYTGSAWANLDTTGMTNPMTTTGDTIYSSSGSTPARLGIGSTGQVLTVAGGVPSWATPGSGSLTLLSTTSLTGNAVDITSISTSYKDLRVLIKDITFNSNEAGPRIRFNNNSTSAAYQTIYYGAYEGTVAGLSPQSDTSFFPFRITPNASSDNALFVIDIPDYANTTTHKTVTCIASWNEYGFTTTGQKMISVAHGGWFATPAAINEINIFMTASKTFSSGTVEIYGVN